MPQTTRLSIVRAIGPATSHSGLDGAYPLWPNRVGFFQISRATEKSGEAQNSISSFSASTISCRYSGKFVYY